MPERWGAVRRKVAVALRAEDLLKALRRRLAGCSLLAAALTGLSDAAVAQSHPDGPKWNPWVELGGLGADDDDSHAIIELWAPLTQGPTALFFFDGKFQFIEDNAQEGNAQFGLRKMTPSGWNLGAWLSGDVRETSLDNTFWQVAGGLEALSVKWDLRLNGYLPVTDPQVTPSTAKLKLTRNNLFMIGGQEVALHGVDGEIGYLLLGSPQTKQGTRQELRIYGGGFWFDDEDAIGEVAGPSARLELRIDNLIPDWGGSRLTFDAGYSHDDVRGDLWEAGARVRIPLGGTATYALLSPQARRMQERIERDDDIITVKSGPEKVFDTLTGVRFDRVAYVNPSITDTSNKAGDNSLLIVNGTVSGPQELQGNQALQGGGSTIKVTGTKSGVTKPFTAPGASATLVDPGLAPNLTLLGSNTHVAGLDIHGVPNQFLLVPPFFIPGNAAGISVPGPSENIVIEQTSIANTGFAGISFGANNSNVRIFDTAITNGGSLGGIFFGIDNRNITISDVRIADTFGSGIFLGTGARHVSISDTTISGITLGSGIGLGDADDVLISNVFISDIANVGILGSNGNDDVRISNSTITGTGSDGIRFGSNNDVTIRNLDLASIGGIGIDFDSNNCVDISDVAMVGLGNFGINFNSNNEVAIRNATFNQIANDAIDFNQFNVVTIQNVQIASTTNNGIAFNSNNGVDISNIAINSVANFGITFNQINVVTIQNAALSSIGASGIDFNSNNRVDISDITLNGVGNDGINFVNFNVVTIQNAALRDIADRGIDFNRNNVVSIVDTTITNVGTDGIAFGNDNTVNITGTTIADVDGNGIQFGEGNIFALNNSTLAGMFGIDGIFTPDTNTLSGNGNTAAGATFGGQFCNVAGGQGGPGFAFVDDGSGNPATCPPP